MNFKTNEQVVLTIHGNVEDVYTDHHDREHVIVRWTETEPGVRRRLVDVIPTAGSVEIRERP